jgi:hypothetical protein
LQPQPPLLPQPLLPQQQKTIMRRMIIQQQLPEPNPLHMCCFLLSNLLRHCMSKIKIGENLVFKVCLKFIENLRKQEQIRDIF